MKGWPIWFLPTDGHAALKAIPKQTTNLENSSVSNMKCIDPLGNSDVCNMTCKIWIDPIISLTNITDNNFDSFNCTLIVQTTNNSLTYTLDISEDSYLVFFTNWTSDEYNFSCFNSPLPENSSMICRHDSVQCLPSTTTYKCVSSHCQNTPLWTNNNTNTKPTHIGYNCSHYEITYAWCYRGTFTANYKWTLGSYYSYPEFNCCGCGKGWPLWFVPSSGYTSTKVVPELTENTNGTNVLCIDTYGNSLTCNMTCKLLTNPVILTETIAADDFNAFNCTLVIDRTNSSVAYAIRIPQDNYLVYFTNWTTSDFNFACKSMQVPSNISMLCRHDFTQYLTTTITTDRYIPANCVDTPDWANKYSGSPTGKGFTCFEYEIIYKWCTGGTFTPGSQWTLGKRYNFPEVNCCACGKASQTPYQLLNMTIKSNSTIPSDFSIINMYNCTAVLNSSFNLECLGPSNFTKSNITTNAILYNCPLDCFFNRNLTTIDMSRTVNATRRQIGSNITYYLSSNLFPNFQVTCRQSLSQLLFSTEQSTIPTTSIDNQNTSEVSPTSSPTTEISTELVQTAPASQPSILYLPTCSNGNIGLICNVTTDLCQMTNPCLNSGSCTNLSPSSYICMCIQGFIGSNCEIDIRPCQPWTCLNHGFCNETSPTTFQCECHSSYEGLHCESKIDYCQNITCQNNGQCRSMLLNFTCECTAADFTGRFCEVQSTKLVIKTIVKKAFGYIAITAIVSLISTIVILDILRYVFKIDPIAKDRRNLRRRRYQQRKKRPKSIVHFVYVDTPRNDLLK
ncbi:hypothetical protein I4U23_017194 [Adineta vaga]|nr:hypothetical protein I4U23_017194 [Adineta vaga]